MDSFLLEHVPDHVITRVVQKLFNTTYFFLFKLKSMDFVKVKDFVKGQIRTFTRCVILGLV